mgnify:CR=1 FL=1|jgi:O-antigen/teichoic acid export membrane protein|tara:strand:- start:20245 stop:21585 length:1341 start_codon:yes stop_codon:yes gene_type:complete
MSDGIYHGQRSGSLRGLAANFAWLLGGRTAAAVFSLIYLAILTRTLGPVDYGQFALIIGTAQAVTAFVSFQTWQVVVRFGMDRLRAGREGDLVALLKFCILLDIAGALVGAVLAVILVLSLAPLFGWSDQLVRYALIFAAASLLFVKSTPNGILRLYDRFAVAANVEAALTAARLVGAVIVWLATPSIGSFILVWALAEFAACALSWVLALRASRSLRWSEVPAHPRQVLQDTPGLGRFAVITNIAQMVGLAGKQVPVLLTGLFVGPAAAGGFQIALQLGNALTKVGALAVQTLLPELMRAKTFAIENGEQAFRRLLNSSLAIGAIAGTVVLLVVVLFGRFALTGIAGPEFASAYPLLVLIALASAISLATVPLEPALYASGGEMAAVKVRVVTTALAVAAMAILGAYWDAIGIAFAILGGALIAGVALAWSLKRHIDTGNKENGA